MSENQHGSVLFWGFQGTIDYRVQLEADQFAAVGFAPPGEDGELFVSKAELRRLLDLVARAGGIVARVAGGCPLMSATSTQGWLKERASLRQESFFLGAAPPEIDSLLDEDLRSVLSFAHLNPAIGGTLALEYPPASAKLMLAVPEGRWLNQTLAEAGLRGLRKCLAKTTPRRFAVGIGGLNKADPQAVLWLMRRARELGPDCVLYAAGSSFAKALTGGLPSAFWADLRQVYATADIVSVSLEEERQLASVWGDGWADALFQQQTKLVVTHSPGGATYRAAGSIRRYLPEPALLLQEARDEASRHARVLTGLGARFDGVLSALVLANWQDRRD